MADSKADKARSEGVEVAENYDAMNFEDGLDATYDGSVVSVGIKDGGVTHAKRVVVQARTATADGLTTGLVTSGTNFVVVTSANSAHAITLPAAATAGIGQSIDLHVGANGYELITPASSNNTINNVDADGTNQLDVAANTLLRCVQITATGWACYQVAATTITVVAPDND
jgi:hypothetical protein